MLSKSLMLSARARTGLARSSKARVRLVMLASVTVALASTAFTSPAEAVPGERLVGHRCRTYDAAETNEDTLTALVDTAKVAGAWCEIDVKRLSDGIVVVWHDPTWARVADPTTLPAGVRPSDRVEDATWEQVRQIRTRGGSPVTRFGRMIDAAGANGVPLLVEVHNDSIRWPRYWLDRAREAGARVMYYQPVSPACTTVQLDALEAAGAIVGIKTKAHAPCQLTPGELQAKDASLVVQDGREVTSGYVDAMNAHGIKVIARGATSSTAQSLLQKGVDRLMVDRPREASDW